MHRIPSSNSRYVDCFRDVLNLAVSRKKATRLSPLTFTGTSSTMTFVIRVPMYSVCRWTEFLVMVLAANFLASFSAASKIFHNAFDLLARILFPILKVFNAWFIVTLLTRINLRYARSAVSREIVLVCTAPISSGIVRNSFLLVFLILLFL